MLGTVTDSTVTAIEAVSIGDGSHVTASQTITDVTRSTVKGIGTVTIGSAAPAHQPPVDPAIARDAKDRWDRSKGDIERVRSAAAAGDMETVNSAQRLSEREARLREKGLGLEGRRRGRLPVDALPGRRPARDLRRRPRGLYLTAR